MKDMDYVMKIMTGWMTLDELEVKNTRRYFIDISGTKEKKQLTDRNPFEINFMHIHQL